MSQKISYLLLFLLSFFLLCAGDFLTVEHFDGFEYILSAQTLWGDSTYFYPKNPLFITLLAAIYAPVRASKLEPSLAPYHLALVIIHLGFVCFVARWMRRYCSSLSTVTVAVIYCSSLYFMQYVPFALSDMTVGATIALWWMVDTSLPMESRRGRAVRAIVFGLCALGRLQTSIIPAVCLLVHAVRSRKLIPGTQIFIGAALVYLTGVGLFFGLLPETSFLQGIGRNLAFLRYYFTSITRNAHGVWWEQLANIALMLTPVGFFLFLIGVVIALKKSSRERILITGPLLGPLLGTGAFLAFLMGIRTEGPQYLSPLLPTWTLFQCFTIDRLMKKNMIAGNLVVVTLFFCAFIPTVIHFSRPAYRADTERTAAVRIRNWRREVWLPGRNVPPPGSPDERMLGHLNEFMFVRPGKFMFAYEQPALVPLKSKRAIEIPEIDPLDNMYYGSDAAFTFYAREPLRPSPLWYDFNRFGFPIPDRIRELPTDLVAVVPPDRIISADGSVKMTPYYALRRTDNAVEIYSPEDNSVHSIAFQH